VPLMWPSVKMSLTPLVSMKDRPSGNTVPRHHSVDPGLRQQLRPPHAGARILFAAEWSSQEWVADLLDLGGEQREGTGSVGCLAVWMNDYTACCLADCLSTSDTLSLCLSGLSLSRGLLRWTILQRDFIGLRF